MQNHTRMRSFVCRCAVSYGKDMARRLASTDMAMQTPSPTKRGLCGGNSRSTKNGDTIPPMLRREETFRKRVGP